MNSSGEDRQRRITLVTFGHVRPTHRGADGSTWELIQYLNAEDRLAAVICCDFDSEAASTVGVPFVVPRRRIFRWVSFLIEWVGRGSSSWARRSRERFFDYLVRHSPILHQSECVVFRKPNFELTAKVLCDLDIPTLAIASILHPRTNYERVGAEAEKRNLVDHSPYRDRLRLAQLESFFDRCDRILTTEVVGEESFRQQGISPDRLVTTRLMNGADCDRFSPRQDVRSWGPLRFLHLSAMNLIKGVGPLFEAWARSGLEESELVLAGSMDASTQYLFERQVTPGRRWIGPVDNSPLCYREADVFISPSLSDSAPNTILEALASGLPVIASDACGASILIEHGVNGLIYPWNDVAALESCIVWCSQNRSRLASMGQAARETALLNPRGKFGAEVLRAADSIRR